MRELRSSWTVLLLFLGLAQEARPNPNHECNEVDTLIGIEAASPPVTGTWKGLNVWARDSGGTYTIPTGAELMWDTTDEASLTRYFDDVSYGALHVIAKDIFADDTSFRYIVIDTTLRILSSVRDVCELGCLWRGADSICVDSAAGCLDSSCTKTNVVYEDIQANHWSERMQLFFRRIMKQVDARVNFADYDLNGPNGVPDSIVDFVNFYISAADNGQA